MYLHSDDPINFFNIYHPQKGGEYFPIFQANLGRQRGHGIGGIFQNLSRFLKPLFEKYVLPHAARAVRNVAVDIVDNNRPWKHAITEEGVNALKGISHDILNQSGSGRPRKRKHVRKAPNKIVKRTKKSKKKTVIQVRSKNRKQKSKRKSYRKSYKKLKSIFDY